MEKLSEQTGMTDQQIEVLADTMANPEAALRRLEATNPDLVAEIRGQQQDVADTIRRANSNPDILNLRIG